MRLRIIIVTKNDTMQPSAQSLKNQKTSIGHDDFHVNNLC